VVHRVRRLIMIKRSLFILIIIILSCSRTDREYSPTGPTGPSSGEGNLGGSTRVYTPGVKGTLVAQPSTVTGGGVITITVNDEDEAGSGGVVVSIASSRDSLRKRLKEVGRGLFQGAIEVGPSGSKSSSGLQFLIVNTVDGDTVVISYLDNRNDKGEQELITASVTVAVSKPVISPSTVSVKSNEKYIFTVSGGTAPYTWLATCGTFTNPTGSAVEWTAPSVTTTTTCYITVIDATNFSDTATVTVSP